MTKSYDRDIETDENGIPAGPANSAFVRRVHDRGLAFDLRTINRRTLLGLAGGLGAMALVGCGTPTSEATSATAAPDTAPADGSAADCTTEINSETNGPYPADGTNGVEIRTVDGVVRTDIRSSFGSSTGTAEGITLTATFTLQDLSCTPMAGAALYIWHCDRDGNYSLYSEGVTDQNYLRGIAETDANGQVTFTTIVPACYAGRWPHIHFEVYESVADAISGSGTTIKTSQLAFPADVCDAVYATDGYSGSVTNLSQLSLATDNVFSDDEGAHQLGTATGSVTDGYAVTLTVAVDPSGSEAAGGRGTPPTGMPGGPGGQPPPPGG